jgi:hypothetical protein
MYVGIITSNRNYINIQDTNQIFAADPAYGDLNYSVIADMDANDTATVSMYQSGGAAQCDLQVVNTYFSGCLLA